VKKGLKVRRGTGSLPASRVAPHGDLLVGSSCFIASPSRFEFCRVRGNARMIARNLFTLCEQVVSRQNALFSVSLISISQSRCAVESRKFLAARSASTPTFGARRIPKRIPCLSSPRKAIPRASASCIISKLRSLATIAMRSLRCRPPSRRPSEYDGNVLSINYRAERARWQRDAL